MDMPSRRIPISGNVAGEAGFGHGAVVLHSIRLVVVAPLHHGRGRRRLRRHRRFAIDHQVEPLFEGERGDVGLALLVVEGLGHAGEPESDETFVGVVAEHIPPN
jgi:hypothetical protein